MDDPVGPILLVLPALALAAVISVPVGLAALRVYRRAVLRSMREAAGDRVPHAPAPPPPARPGGRAPIEFVEAPDGRDDAGAAAELRSAAVAGPRRTAAGLAVAGCAHAATLLVLLRGQFDDPLQWSFVAALLFWPTLVTLSFVAAERRWIGIGVPCLWLAALLPFGLVFSAADPRVPMAMAYFVVPVLLVILALAHPRLRSVGVLLLPPVAAVLTGLFLGAAVGLLDFGPGKRAAGVVLLAFSLAAIGYLPLVARRYRRKKTSDQVLVVTAFWVFVTLWDAAIVAVEAQGVSRALGLLPLLAFLGTDWGTRRWILRRRRRERPIRLLLLRVFGARAQSEGLLRALGRQWRYIGSIQMIAGPDLASATLEPHEFLDFVTGKLSRRFVKDREDLEQQIADMDLLPDPDGRYRVSELFCHDDTWRDALERLVDESDAVLMDLRGFTRANEGCVFELHHLVDVVPAERIVFAIDDATDEAFLRETLDAGWSVLPEGSPNVGTDANLRAFRMRKQGAREARRLLALLCEAATTA